MPDLTDAQKAQVRTIRLLINAPTGSGPAVFTDEEIVDFLALEDGSLKRAAAQAIDTIADNEALVSKVIKDGDLSTDGAKVAAELRKRAAALRTQADEAEAEEDDASGDGHHFGIVNIGSTTPRRPELTGW